MTGLQEEKTPKLKVNNKENELGLLPLKVDIELKMGLQRPIALMIIFLIRPSFCNKMHVLLTKNYIVY